MTAIDVCVSSCFQHESAKNNLCDTVVAKDDLFFLFCQGSQFVLRAVKQP